MTAWKRGVVIGTASAAAIAVSFWLSLADHRYLLATEGRELLPFELLGVLGGLVLVGWMALAARRRSLDEALPALVSCGVGLVWLGYLAEHSQRSFDWNCFQTAAEQLSS